MVEITLTLIVQAIHFFIAYMLLRYLFLQPSLLLLVEQKNQKILLKKAIQVARKRVEYQQKIKDDCCALSQKTFAAACQDIENVMRANGAYKVQPIDSVPIVIFAQALEQKKQQAEELLIQTLEKSE